MLIDYTGYGLHRLYKIQIFKEICQEPISQLPGLGRGLGEAMAGAECVFRQTGPSEGTEIWLDPAENQALSIDLAENQVHQVVEGFFSQRLFTRSNISTVIFTVGATGWR